MKNRERFELTQEEQKEVYCNTKILLEKTECHFIRPIEAARIRQLIKEEYRGPYPENKITELGNNSWRVRASPLDQVVSDVKEKFMYEFTGYHPSERRSLGNVFAIKTEIGTKEKIKRNGYEQREYIRSIIDSQYSPCPTPRNKKPLNISPRMPNLAELDDLWKSD